MRAPFLALAILALAACEEAPPASPTDSPFAPTVQLSGRWEGTFSSSDIEPQSIDFRLVQIGNVLTGNYSLTPSGARGQIANGLISGNIVGATLFFDGGGGCQGAGSFEGPLSSSRLELSSPGFSRSIPCFIGNPGELPQDVTISLERR